MHALCKLPRDDLQQKSSKLTNQVLKRHRERWRTAVAMFLDEISMVSPEQLHQTNVRVQQATRQTQRLFGGLLTVLSGDFLQLPPVERGSLARQSTAVESHDGEDTEMVGEKGEAPEADTGDASQGFHLWHGIPRVISLSVNIRAPGLLGRLQTEMRNGEISEEMWRLYESRILRDGDLRLQQPPFSTSDVQYIVHRHRIRVSQNFKNAIEHCRKNNKRLYVVKASVEVPLGNEDVLTSTTLEELLSITGLKKQVMYLVSYLSMLECVCYFNPKWVSDLDS